MIAFREVVLKNSKIGVLCDNLFKKSTFKEELSQLSSNFTNGHSCRMTGI